MHAIDTNVVVRLLIADDERQASAARKLLAEREVFVSTTVILETEWVMRSGYDFTPQRIGAGLRALGGLPGVTFEDPSETAQALDWHDAGMDFADALHLAKAAHCKAFATFDRKLARTSKALGTMPVEAI